MLNRHFDAPSILRLYTARVFACCVCLTLLVISVSASQADQKTRSTEAAIAASESISAREGEEPLRVLVSKSVMSEYLDALETLSSRLPDIQLNIQQVNLNNTSSLDLADVVFATPAELNFLNQGGLVSTGLKHISPTLTRSLGDAAWGRAVCTNTVAAHGRNAQIPSSFEDLIDNKSFEKHLVDRSDATQGAKKKKVKSLGFMGYKIPDKDGESSPCELVAEGKRVAAVSHGIDAVTQKARGAPISIIADRNADQFVPAMVKGTLRETDSVELIAKWSETAKLW